MRGIALLAIIAGGWMMPSNVSAEIRWKRDVNRTVQTARQSRKPILVFVETDWCHYCKKMQRETWSDPKLADPVSQHFETLALDGDRDQKIVEPMQLRGYPATLLFSPDGELIAKKGGYMTAEKTMQWLQETLR